MVDRYLDSPFAWIRDSNGRIYQGRDTQTISTGKSLFITDTISLLNDKLTITPAFRHSGEDRDFTNRANFGSTAPNVTNVNYTAHAAAVKNLPSLGINYQITDTQSVYANGARSFRVPNNSNFFNQGALAVNGSIPNSRLPYVPETANNFDLGYRYAGKKVTFSSSLFYNFLQNRLAFGFDPVLDATTNINVGNSKVYGAEVEGGWSFLPHFALYSSASYTRSIISSDLRTSPTATLDTSGKQFPDTPVILAATSLQYSRNNYYLFAEGKYTGRSQATLINDQSAAGYAVLNIGAGYTFPRVGVLRQVSLKLVADNVTNQDYERVSTGSGSGFTNTAANGPVYYIGAPVSFAVTLSAEFGK